MDETLALIDSLINEILGAKSAAMSKGKKVIVDKEQLLDMLEKLKLMASLQSDNRGFMAPSGTEELVGETHPELFGLEGEALLRQARSEADKIKDGANKYAESVFNNMLISLSKAATAVKNGKDRIKLYQSNSSSGKDTYET